MTQTVKKVVIPAAGMGTRFLPVTKALAKEMLPILTVPTMHYIVNEALEAGIDEILIIVSSHKNSIVDYFDSSFELEQRLLNNKKMKMYEMVKSISKMANIHFIRQKEPKGLGDAIKCAQTFCSNEPFAVILGDDLVFQKQGMKNAIKQCIEAFKQTQSSIVGTQKVSHNTVNKYGILDFKKDKSSTLLNINNLVEKPDINKAPSDYAILGRYVLTPNIFDALDNISPDKSGEIQLTDALQYMLKNNKKIYGCVFNGQRFDAGSKIGYLDATNYCALKDPEISEEYFKHIKKIIAEHEKKK